MEKITNIEIKNFKSIKKVAMNNCKRINVLVGMPNVGKSNILEAMSLQSYIDDNFKCSLQDLIRFENIRDLFSFGQSEELIEVLWNNQSIAFEYLDDDEAILYWRNKLALHENEWDFKFVAE